MKDRIAVIIPTYNEEEAIGSLLDELRHQVPDIDCVVVNDGSDDETAAVARSRGAVVLDLPCNLGVGGAVQAGYQYTFGRGYVYVIRIDGDGQHPPVEIPKLIQEMEKGEADLIIGSRFIGQRSYVASGVRSIGIRLLAVFLSVICRSRITDPTSGFWMVNRKLLYYFSNDYPSEYPEPEAIALLRRYGYSYKEKSVNFRARTTGKSSIRSWGTLYYVFKVGLALIVDRIRPISSRYEKSSIEDLEWL